MIHKLDSTNAFIAFDLDDAPGAVGIVRRARKILQDGAKLLARSTTYSFATFEMQRGGASAGINAEDDARAEAVAAFAGEAGELVSAGRLSLDAGKGVDPAEKKGLADEVRGLRAMAACVLEFGYFDGVSISVEGFEASGVALAR